MVKALLKMNWCVFPLYVKCEHFGAMTAITHKIFYNLKLNIDVFLAIVIHKQVSCRLITPILDLQYSYMLRLQPVDILRELQY